MKVRYIEIRLPLLAFALTLCGCGKKVEQSPETSTSSDVSTTSFKKDLNDSTRESTYEPDYGFSFEVDDSEWKPVPVPVSTLGEPVAVLTNGPQLPAIVVVFVRSQLESEPITDARLKSLSEKMTGLASAFGAEVVSNEIQEIAGRSAVSLQITGP